MYITYKCVNREVRAPFTASDSERELRKKKEADNDDDDPSPPLEAKM